MSDRFWSRCLSHLPGHASGGSRDVSGVETVRSKNGVTHRMVLRLPDDVREAESTAQKLRAELREQQAARQGTD